MSDVKAQLESGAEDWEGSRYSCPAWVLTAVYFYQYARSGRLLLS